jgi:hypothetical protein
MQCLFFDVGSVSLTYIEQVAFQKVKVSIFESGVEFVLKLFYNP